MPDTIKREAQGQLREYDVLLVTDLILVTAAAFEMVLCPLVCLCCAVSTEHNGHHYVCAPTARA